MIGKIFLKCYVYLCYSTLSICYFLISVGDDEDKENRDWTTPKSAKGPSRQRLYSDEEDELNYPKRKERTVSRLVIPEDNYWQSTQPALKTTVSCLTGHYASFFIV